MTNGEKYKTARDRAKALEEFCNSHTCESCPIYCNTDGYDPKSLFAWLELEAEDEKPLPCPFCGEEITSFAETLVKKYKVECYCGYKGKAEWSSEEAIAAHNRVARAVMAANEKEAK